MTSIVHFSEAASIAFHAMVYLTRFSGRDIHRHDIAQAIEVSEAHLSKVLQTLRQAGLISAVRGPHGGYRIAVDPARTSLKTVYIAIDGEPVKQSCLFNRPRCIDKSCLLGNLIKDLSSQVADFLENTTLQHVCDRGMAIVEAKR